LLHSVARSVTGLSNSRVYPDTHWEGGLRTAMSIERSLPGSGFSRNKRSRRF
jgi:hypothetical protein